jgi:hypothetical protein
MRAIRGVPEFARDRIEHGEDRAAVAAAFERVKERREARAHDAEPIDPLSVRETAEGVTVGGVRVSEGRGAHLLDDRQVEALADWCVEHGRANLIANVRRAREVHRANAERQSREHERRLDRHRRQALARQAVREVEHLAAAAEKAELEVGRLVAEGADEADIRVAEGRLADAERQVTRATAKARYLRSRAA